jgi:hypothetical protein
MEHKGAFLFLVLFAAIGIALLFLGSPSFTTFLNSDGGLSLFSQGPLNPIKIISGITGAATKALFDIALTIPPESANINPGQSLLTSVALTNFGSEGQTNVSLTYIVTNSRGYVVFIEHENRVVETQESFLKTLALPRLDSGEYHLFSELIYSNTSAIASGTFNVV